MTQTPNMADVKVEQDWPSDLPRRLTDLAQELREGDYDEEGYAARLVEIASERLTRHAASPSPEQGAGNQGDQSWMELRAKNADGLSMDETSVEKKSTFAADTDLIAIPRGLIGAALHCVRKQAGTDSETYKALSALALSEPLPSAPSDVSIPAGMKAWHGGDRAPDDWARGKPVLERNGKTTVLDEGESGRCYSGWRGIGEYGIIAYTPKAPSDVSEAIAEEMYNLVYHHTVTKYDPEAGKRCIAARLNALSPAASVSAQGVEGLREACAREVDWLARIASASPFWPDGCDEEIRKIAARIRTLSSIDAPKDGEQA